MMQESLTPVYYRSLLSAEGGHGFDVGGAAGRDEACDGGGGGENDDRDGEAHGIVGAYVVELIGHVVGSDHGDGNANEETEARLKDRSAKDHAHDVGTVCSERHAQTDLAGSARYLVRGDAIEADGCEDQRKQAEQGCEARDETLLSEVAGDLVVEGVEVDYSEVGIDVSERAADLGVEILRRPLEVHRDGVDEERPALRHDEIRFGQACYLLGERAKVHWPHVFAGVVVFGVCDDADDLEQRGKLLIEVSEVASHGIFLGKEFFYKRLIDHCDLLRSGGVLLGECSSANDGLTYGLEEVRADAIPRRVVVIVGSGRGASCYVDSFAPVVSFKRAVEREADALDAGQRFELLLELLIERGKRLCRVACTCRVEMEDVAIVGLEAEILMLHVAKTLGEEACSDEQHKRERGLKYDEGFLRQRCTVARGTVAASQRLRRIGMRCDQDRK